MKKLLKVLSREVSNLIKKNKVKLKNHDIVTCVFLGQITTDVFIKIKYGI